MLTLKFLTSLDDTKSTSTEIEGAKCRTKVAARPARRQKSRPALRRKKSKEYQIVEVEEDTLDEMYCPTWIRCAVKFLPITAAASVISGYTYWKLQFGQLLLLRAMGMDMNARIFWAIIELICSVPTLFKAVLDTISMLNPKPRRKHLRLVGDFVPTVDIIITTCNEATDICLDTARAAINIDYPASRFRVIIADDGADPDLKKGIEDMAKTGRKGTQLYYITRVKGKDDRHKAGNLNNALRFAKSLPGGQSEFSSGLDADMIPMRNILRAQLPHLLQNPKLGGSCPAATFYNVPTNDPLLQSQSVHNKWEEFSRDRVNDAWCTGSGWVYRNVALNELGGFPMQTVGEDAFCSTGLANLGWNTVFVAESLQFGLVPDTYSSHLKQHRRWKLGGLVIGLDKNLGLYGSQIAGLSWVSRAWWFYYGFRTLTLQLIVLGLFTAPLFLFLGYPAVVYATPNDLKQLVQASAVSYICTFLLRCHMGLKTGYRAQMMEQCNELWIAPYHALTQLQTYILPTWLGGQILTFVPTGSIPNQLYERDAKRRVSLGDRLRSIMIKDGAILHVILSIFSVVSVASVLLRAQTQFPDRSSDYWMYMLTHLGWMPLGWFFSFFALLTPIRYAIFPPTVPEREDLLVRDPATGAGYPVRGARGAKWVPELLGFENCHLVAVLYSAVVLYYSSQW